MWEMSVKLLVCCFPDGLMDCHRGWCEMMGEAGRGGATVGVAVGGAVGGE